MLGVLRGCGINTHTITGGHKHADPRPGAGARLRRSFNRIDTAHVLGQTPGAPASSPTSPSGSYTDPTFLFLSHLKDIQLLLGIDQIYFQLFVLKLELFETVLVSPIKEDNPLPRPFLFLKILFMLPLQCSFLELKTHL